MSTPSSRSTDCGVMCPWSSSTGTVSVNLPEPLSRITGETASPVVRNSQNSEMPPTCTNSEVLSLFKRLSVTTMVSPGTKNEVWRARAWISPKSKAASGVKICESAQNLMRVPVAVFFAGLPAFFRPPCLVNLPVSSLPTNTPGAPRLKLMTWVLPERSTSTSMRLESALTTEAPTPCKPPDAV